MSTTSRKPHRSVIELEILFLDFSRSLIALNGKSKRRSTYFERTYKIPHSQNDRADESFLFMLINLNVQIYLTNCDGGCYIYASTVGNTDPVM